MTEDREKRAERTFPMRPLPTGQDRPKSLAAGNPAAAWGPYPEGTWLVLVGTDAFRVRAVADMQQAEGGANPLAALGTDSVQLAGGGIPHDFTMPAGCQWVVASPVTQPPPANCQIAVWPSDAPSSVCGERDRCVGK